MDKFPQINIFNYTLEACTMNEAVAWSLAAVQEPTPKLLVTLNPEIIIQGQTDQLME